MGDNTPTENNSKRYRILIAGVIIQFCAGIIYMWSVFKKPVEEYLIWDGGASAMTASVMLVAFVAGIFFGGRIMDRIGPKKMCVLGSIIMSGGILMSSFVTSDFPFMLYITYGILGGFGVGAVYTCTVSTIQKWFYDKRGFATGMMVGAFGFSLVIFTPLANYLLSDFGVPSTFQIFGVLFLIICVAASLIIMNPPENYTTPKAAAPSSQKQYVPKEMLRTKTYYLITLSLFFILSAFFVLNPMFKSLGMERGLSESLAILGVMIIGICSASGRLLITWMSDHIGRMTSIIIITALTLIGTVLVIFAEGYLFILCLALIALGFGGAAGTYTTITSDYFGTKNMGSNYGYVMFGFGASALVFPLISTMISTDGDYTLTFVMCALAAVASLICILLLRKYSDVEIVSTS
ncbi:OFA family MFS transporter [Bacteroidales bacterium OttesenSCG-928-L03]|nr:OFA family MFS transporter [Bacteroidales bacterium OttesenSCG-928-L03]